MNPLNEYVRDLANNANLNLDKGQIFAKVLTSNDDAGRHGVLIPTDVYSFFPNLEIADPRENSTTEFYSYDGLDFRFRKIAFKYYERYPERRITRLSTLLNDRDQGRRLCVIIKGTTLAGDFGYVDIAVNESEKGRFFELWRWIAGDDVEPTVGAYVQIPVAHKKIELDDPLNELLVKFDSIRDTWIDSLRVGDTGIGYTFETLLGIPENNSKQADFKGIELKCKHKKEKGTGNTGKINLFQQGPVWSNKQSARTRLRQIGHIDEKDLASCFSQVNTNPNNLQLSLLANPNGTQLDLKKSDQMIGYWLHQKLESRLLEKHSRTAFISASVSHTKFGDRFRYEELVYCESPTIDKFLELVFRNQLVFEFLMYEQPDGKVRNRGYPWRLSRDELLDQLFSVRIKLR